MKRLLPSHKPISAAMLLLALTGGVGAMALDGSLQTEPRAAGVPAFAEPFESANVVPADVSLYVSIRDAARVRAEIVDRPISRWLHQTLTEGQAGRGWSQIAQRARMEPDDLFDALLGRQFSLVVRANADADAQRTEWAVMTEMDPASRAAEDALRALRPIALGPKSRMALLELPEHELLIARRANLTVVGPKHNAGLFEDILRLAGGKVEARTLAHVIRESAIWDERENAQPPLPAVAGLYMRHDPPLGGQSIAVANLARDNLTIRHHGAFDASPFTRSISRIRIDSAILDAFEEQAMIALVEPTDIGRSAFETFLLATIGDGLLSPKMRANLGERRIIILGEVDGRQEVEPIDAHLPAAAVCFEIKRRASGTRAEDSPIVAEPMFEDFDRQMLRLVRRINHMSGVVGSLERDLPGPASFKRNSPRSVHVESGDLFPHASSLIPRTLNWTIVESDLGAFYVIATHPAELAGAMRALGRKAEIPGDPRCSGPEQPAAGLHSCGVINGPRIAHHLLALRDSELSQQIVGEDEAQQKEFRGAMMLLSDLASGMERVRWHLARPSETEVDLEVRIRLAPPELSGR